MDSLTCWPRGCARTPLNPRARASPPRMRIGLTNRRPFPSNRRPRRRAPHTQTSTHMQSEWRQPSTQSHVWDRSVSTLQTPDAPPLQNASIWVFTANLQRNLVDTRGGISFFGELLWPERLRLLLLTF